jgi:hypothetical protein
MNVKNMKKKNIQYSPLGIHSLHTSGEFIQLLSIRHLLKSINMFFLRHHHRLLHTIQLIHQNVYANLNNIFSFCCHLALSRSLLVLQVLYFSNTRQTS